MWPCSTRYQKLRLSPVCTSVFLLVDTDLLHDESHCMYAVLIYLMHLCGCSQMGCSTHWFSLFQPTRIVGIQRTIIIIIIYYFFFFFIVTKTYGKGGGKKKKKKKKKKNMLPYSQSKLRYNKSLTNSRFPLSPILVVLLFSNYYNIKQ